MFQCSRICTAQHVQLICCGPDSICAAGKDATHVYSVWSTIFNANIYGIIGVYVVEVPDGDKQLPVFFGTEG